MKQNKTLCIFTGTNARVFEYPSDEFFKEASAWPNCVPGPDLSNVDGVPPHFWKQEGGVVVPMNKAEQEARLEKIERFGVDNVIRPQNLRFERKRVLRQGYMHFCFYVLILTLLIAILWRIQ